MKIVQVARMVFITIIGVTPIRRRVVTAKGIWGTDLQIQIRLIRSKHLLTDAYYYKKKGIPARRRGERECPY